MPAPTDLIVTAADEGFAPLLRGLLGSLVHAGWTGEVAVLDLGLSAQTRAWVDTVARHRVEPGWDLPVAPALRERQPQLRALTARPFLPRYFPGHARYLWIDADAWVQEAWVLARYLDACRGGRIAITPQVDRCYLHRQDLLGWRLERLQAGFGRAAAERALWETYVNAGAFALEAGAPRWEAWARHFAQGLSASGGMVCCDQSALNHLLWTERLPQHPLQATCNWLCHLALPAVERGSGRLVEPLAPHAPLGLVHLTALAKEGPVRLPGEDGPRVLDLRSPHGARVAMPVGADGPH